MKLDWLRPCVFSLAVAVIFVTGARAPAQSAFDGGWSVLVITEAGTCGQSYRYPVQIMNGTVVYDTVLGSGVVQISGKVDSGGQVKVTVQRGEQQAVGAGRLLQTAGGGTWTGEAATQGCSGRWEATRN